MVMGAPVDLWWRACDHKAGDWSAVVLYLSVSVFVHCVGFVHCIVLMYKYLDDRMYMHLCCIVLVVSGWMCLRDDTNVHYFVPIMSDLRQDLRKGVISHKTLIFTTFQTVSTPRPLEPLASHRLRILVTVAKWSKNIHIKFQVCSYYSFKAISVSKLMFGICVKLSLCHS